MNKILRYSFMSLLNSEVLPFEAQAFHNGNFVSVSNANLKGR